MKKNLVILFTLLAAAAAGCTVFGEPYDDPAGELSVRDEVREFCRSGAALFFGHVRNTGELEVRDISAIVSVFGGDGSFLGSFTAPVTESIEEVDIIELDENGDPVLDEEGNEIVLETIILPIDTLDVDQSGSFSVETTVGCSAAARSEVSFDFTVGVFTDEDF